MKRMFYCIFGMFLFATTAHAQDGRTILQRALQGHTARARSVDEILAVGEITRGTERAERVTISTGGVDRIRIETGVQEPRTVLFAGEEGWTGVPGHFQVMETHAAKRRPTIFPFLDLLTELNNPRLEVTLTGTEPWGTRSVHRVLLRLPDARSNVRLFRRALDEAVELYIDTETFLVLRSVRWRTAETNLDLRVPSTLDFSDYRDVSGLQVPFRIVNTIGSSAVGLQISTMVLQTVVINPGFSSERFDPR